MTVVGEERFLKAGKPSLHFCIVEEEAGMQSSFPCHQYHLGFWLKKSEKNWVILHMMNKRDFDILGKGRVGRELR